MKVATSVLVLLLSVFAVNANAATADLIVTSWTNQRNVYSFSVSNGGPDVAENVVLTVDIPAALEVLPIDGARCDTTVRPVRCHASKLEPRANDVLEFGFEVEAAPADATYTLTATASSATTDPRPENNSKSETFSTRLTAELSPYIEPELARLEPGAVHVFKTEVRNWIDTSPRNIRIRYTTTNGTIEAIQPTDPRWTCSFSATSGECVTTVGLEPNCRCSRPIHVAVRAGSDRAGGEGKLEMVATSELPSEYKFPGTGTLQTYRMIAVTNTADSGPGSLRHAIEQANANCTPGPCKIAFEIPAPVPPAGWFTIDPATPYPPIAGQRVVLDGTTQTRLTGDTNPDGPEVAIDGHRALHGVEIRATCDSVVEGLTMGRFFAGYGLTFVSGTCADGFSPVDRKLVTRNYLGVDPTGTKAWPNLRGLQFEGDGIVDRNNVSRNLLSGIWMWRGSADITRNTIVENGRSGIVLGPESVLARVSENNIHRQREMGVAIAREAQLYLIDRNSMIDNGGLGIDIGIDGRSPVDADDRDRPTNAPVLLHAHYDASRDRTVVTMTLKSTPLGPYGNQVQLSFFGNRGPDGDGERWLGPGNATEGVRGDGTPFPVELLGNHTGQWLNATATRYHYSFSRPPDDKMLASPAPTFSGEGAWTSELSNAVLVTP